MEIRIDGWAWLPKGELGAQADWLRKGLTVADVRQRKPVLHRAYLEKDDLIGIPRSFFRDSVTRHHDVSAFMADGEWPARLEAPSDSSWAAHQDGDLESLTVVDSVSGKKDESLFTDAQRVASREILSSLANRPDGVALFESEQSAAKVCLPLIRSLKRKTLVVAPGGTSFSMWQTVLQRYLPDAQVGLIRRGEVVVDGCHVVLTTVSDLLLAVKEGRVADDEFGFIISHCMHRMDPLEWASAVCFFRPSKRLGIAGLGAQFNQGLFRIYGYHLGAPVYSALPDVLVPKIRRVWSGWKVSHWARANPQFISKTALVDQMCLSSSYNKHVVEQVVLALKADRKVVLFSEKVPHLRTLKMQIESEWTGPHRIVDFVIDGMSEEDIGSASESDVILTTFGFAKSFPEVPAIDTVVLATPVRDPGSACRVCLGKDPEKKSPVIVDMRCDDMPACKDYGRSRDEVYRRIYGEGEAQ